MKELKNIRVCLPRCGGAFLVLAIAQLKGGSHGFIYQDQY